jgi:O-methyltransferase
VKRKVKRNVKALAKRTVIECAKHVRAVRKIGAHLAGAGTYFELRERFIRNGHGARWDESVRCRIAERFEVIDRHVPIWTTPTDGLFLAEALLSTAPEGAIVECGCFAGGSTAKLSIVAAVLKRPLVVFDSFEGLPTVEQEHRRDFHVRRGSDWAKPWWPGRYAARLDLVRHNVERYGDISVCTFKKGWFSETLREGSIPDRVCFAFTDVDIASSARECLVAIWPRLAEFGMYFSHDVAYIKVLNALMDRKLWSEELHGFPPVLFGAGYGLGDSSPHLGFFVKGETATPEYINSLTIEK